MKTWQMADFFFWFLILLLVVTIFACVLVSPKVAWPNARKVGTKT